MDKNITLVKLENILKEKDWSIYRLAKESDISLSDFFADDTIPTITEYTSEERKLITHYRNLKTSDKKLLMTYAQTLNRKIPED